MDMLAMPAIKRGLRQPLMILVQGLKVDAHPLPTIRDIRFKLCLSVDVYLCIDASL